MSVGSCEKRHWDTGQLHRQHRIGCCWVGLTDLIRSTCYSDNENLLVIGDTLYLDLESLEEEAYEFLFTEQIYLIEIHLKMQHCDVSYHSLSEEPHSPFPTGIAAVHKWTCAVQEASLSRTASSSVGNVLECSRPYQLGVCEPMCTFGRFASSMLSVLKADLAACRLQAGLHQDCQHPDCGHAVAYFSACEPLIARPAVAPQRHRIAGPHRERPCCLPQHATVQLAGIDTAPRSAPTSCCARHRSGLV